jgi:hypothetical protein
MLLSFDTSPFAGTATYYARFRAPTSLFDEPASAASTADMDEEEGTPAEGADQDQVDDEDQVEDAA